jgi:PPOX class probable F420-dependent enzyme
MRLNEEECWERLATAEHGVLATLHPERGVDAVPVVFAVAPGRRLLLPVDTVKAKSTTDLQRLANLAHDGRCVLLVDDYRADWSQLWWVRVHGVAAPAPGESPAPLVAKYPAYAEPGAVASVVVLTPTLLTGWAAEPRLGDDVRCT